MEYGSIERELYVDASPEVLFDVLTRPEHIREWWSADTQLDLTPGSSALLTWTDDSTSHSQSTPLVVVESDPPRRFAFRWTYDEEQHPAAGNSLLVTFDLIPARNGTTLRFSETGYRERGWEAAVLEAHYNDHRQGWNFYLPRVATLAARIGASR